MFKINERQYESCVIRIRRDISRIKIISIWKNLRKPRCISLIKAGYEFCVVISEDTRGISANQSPALPGPANQRPVWGDTSDQCSRQISPAPAVPRLQPLLLQLTHFLSSFNLSPSNKWWNITHHNPQFCSQWSDLPSHETHNLWGFSNFSLPMVYSRLSLWWEEEAQLVTTGGAVSSPRRPGDQQGWMHNMEFKDPSVTHFSLWSKDAYWQGRPCFSGNFISVICFVLVNQLNVHLYGEIKSWNKIW